jgi:anti-sigma-K factor RskA
VNIQELIESGSLELYVMDALPADEARQIDAARKVHPDVEQEIQRIETTLEDFALAQARVPQPELKEEIAKRIGFGVELDLDMENVKSVIIHLQPLVRFAIAASVAIAILFAGTSAYFFVSYKNANKELANLKQQQTVLATQTKLASYENEQIKQQLAVVMNPSSEAIVLNGLKISPEAKAVVYWNKQTGEAFINSSALPKVADNEQYQLWAIVGGKPVDLGVIADNASFSKSKSIAAAEAFAITLEPLGGSPSPTIEKMFVMGKVKA